MAELKDRVGTLEVVLGSFIVQTEKAIKELKEEMKEFKEDVSVFVDESQKSRERSEREMKTFREEMQAFREDSQKSRERSEREMKVFTNEMQKSRERSDREMQAFKNESQKSHERSEKEMQAFKAEMREGRKKMSMEWGHLANRLGTIAEDIAAPGIKGMLEKYFQLEADRFMVRIKARNITEPSVRKEFDVMAVTENLFVLGEIKTTLRQQYIEDFLQLIAGEIYDYFPEYREKKLVPVFASLSMDESLISFFTKHNIIALDMGVDHMEVMNESVLAKYIMQ